MYAIIIDKLIGNGNCSCGADKSCYPMLYYAQHDPFGRHQDPRFERPGAPFSRMPSGYREPDPLYYTIDERGRYVLMTPNGNIPVASRQSDIGRRSGERRQALPPPAAAARSGSTASSQPSDPSPSFHRSRNHSGMLNASCSRQSDGIGSKPRFPSTYKTYKTLLCNMFETNGSCSFGVGCQYAHGKEEIRPYRPHPKYKTQLCNKVNTPRGCRYRHKCYFRHPDDKEIQSHFYPNDSSPQRSTSLEGPGNARDEKKKANLGSGGDSFAYARTFRRSTPSVALKRSNSCKSFEAFTRQRCNALKEAIKNHLDDKNIKKQKMKKDVSNGKRNTKE